MACYRPWVSIKCQLIEGESTPRPGPRFSWHRLVASEGANEVVALESGGAAIEFVGQCPYSGCLLYTSIESEH